jgi:hypothetical protein
MCNKGRAFDSSGSNNGRAGFTDQQVVDIIEEYGEKNTPIQEFADRFGKDYVSIWRIINRKTYKNVVV